LKAAEVGFEARREKDEAHGMRFGEITDREVVLVDKLWHRRSGRFMAATREPASSQSDAEERQVVDSRRPLRVRRQHGHGPLGSAPESQPSLRVQTFIVVSSRWDETTRR
jgi:hypothetical protein